MIDYIADIFLAAGAFGAGLYCFVLGRRLNRFNDLEKGVGGAVAVLSAQVDDLTRTLSAAQQTAAQSAQTLTDLTKRAEDMSRRLELQMASLHDIPEAPAPTAQPTQSQGTKPSLTEAMAPARAKVEPMFIRHTAGARS